MRHEVIAVRITKLRRAIDTIIGDVSCLRRLHAQLKEVVDKYNVEGEEKALVG